MNGRVLVLRGDAAHLPLPDESADLLICSPPYFGLRSYTDGGKPYAGQIGAEDTPGEYVAALLRCTRDWIRILKPEGSIFVVLGDKYSGYDNGHGRGRNVGGGERGVAMVPDGPVSAPSVYGIPNKSLMGLPWRYALACVDELGLILRAEIIWQKVNGLPESVQDRVRRSHEQIFHFTKQPRYFTAVDEIREPHTPVSVARSRRAYNAGDQFSVGAPNTLDPAQFCNPLGKLPGSVWEIPSAPLVVPARLGVDHYAAYPPELVRRIVLGWCPSGICTVCGEGRRPVTRIDHEGGWVRRTAGGRHRSGDGNPGERVGQQVNNRQIATITGYACACTPFTDRPGSGQPTRRRDYNPGQAGYPAQGTYGRHQAGEYERVGPRRVYDLEDWVAPPARPGVVVDPFSGTGTSMLVASVLGRIGIGIDRSQDYCRLAQWRTTDPGERARAAGLPKPAPVPEGQQSLFDDLGEVS